MRDRLEASLIAALGPEHVIRNGPTQDELRLPQTLNLGFPGLDGDALLMQLDMAGIAASLGSACASGSARPSPTLMAMRVPDDRVRSSVRFSLGVPTTEAEVDEAVARIVQVVGRITATGGTDLGFGSAFNHLVSSARGSCSPPVDETVCFSVLFSSRRSFEWQRSEFLFPARR